MHLLYLKSIAEHDWMSFEKKIIYLAVIYTAVLIAMIVDLLFGLYKAKQRGELRRSIGLRRTVDKALKYFGLMIISTAMDFIASYVIDFPYLTMVFGLFMCIIEIKSMFEKYDQKDRDTIIMTSRQLVDLLRDRDITKIPELIEKLNEKKEEENKDEDITI